jgi:hypothetical protein
MNAVMSDNIELRSTSNQAVIGRVPSWLAKWGNWVILFVFILLLFISFHFTFPVIVQGQVEISGDTLYIVIPQIKQNQINEGQDVSLRMDDYPYMEYGILQGKITTNSLIRKENRIYIPVILFDERNTIKRVDLLSGMHGSGEIVVEKLPLFYRIIKTK